MCHKKILHLIVLHFPLLIVTTNLGGGEIGLLQTVVYVAVCSVPIRNTVAAGAYEAGMVDAVDVSLQTCVGTPSRIVPC